MKAGWEVKALGEVCDVLSGFAFKSEDYCETGHFLVRIGNVQNGVLVLDNPRYVELDLKTKRFELSEGDVLTSLTGNIGRVAVVQFDHLPAALNQRVAKIVPRKSLKVLPSYFLHFLSSDGFGEPLRRLSHGAAQQNVSPKAISDLPIPLAPLDEQKRIVAVLDSAFEGLTRARAHTETNLQNARELFDRTINVVFDEISKAHSSQEIGRIADHSLGKMLDKSKNKGSPRPYLRNVNVRWFNVETDDVLEMKIQESEEDRYAVRKGDLLICEGGYPGRASIWEDDEPIYFQKALHRVRFPDPVHNRLLMYFLYSQDASGDLKSRFTGTGIQHFTGASLAKLPFPFAPSEIASAAVRQIEAMQEAIQEAESHYRAKLADLDALRQSLLQKAFAGELT